MYIRTKNVKGYEYAYLVENKWKAKEDKKGARQKVKKYLGRVLSYNIENNYSFFEFTDIQDINLYLGNKDYEQVLKDLIAWEFSRHRINDDVLVYHDKCKVIKDNREVCVRLNNGMLCSLTLKRLLMFDGKGSEPEVGKRLARAFVEAGIDVPQEVFIGLFEKVFRGEE
ncbi:hypothetical protein HYX09_04450 [Candidatus Woesearchaeota archaeon]|nr:hypothetical protein [Candidatus Woesearchaeota archaeon]